GPHRHSGRDRPDPRSAQPGPQPEDPAERDPRGALLVRRLRHRVEGLMAPSARPFDEAPPLEIDGMVAIVTGGAGGIGRGIVGALLRRGASVVIADVEQGAIDAAVAALGPLGPVSGHRTDISDEASVADLADHVYGLHGRV